MVRSHFLLNIEMSLLTPPFGLNLFVMKGWRLRYDHAPDLHGGHPVSAVRCNINGFVADISGYRLMAAQRHALNSELSERSGFYASAGTPIQAFPSTDT